MVPSVIPALGRLNRMEKRTHSSDPHIPFSAGISAGGGLESHLCPAAIFTSTFHLLQVRGKNIWLILEAATYFPALALLTTGGRAVFRSFAAQNSAEFTMQLALGISESYLCSLTTGKAINIPVASPLCQADLTAAYKLYKDPPPW